MKKTLKRSLSLILAITIIFSSACVGLSEVDFGSLFAVKAKAATSGTTGDCAWSLDGTVLTISGNGEMGDSTYSSSPWDTSITKVVIKNGVTSIGKYAFEDCKNLTSVTIPSSVKSIGSGAFCGCTSLASVTIPNGVTKIDSIAFYNCESLTSVSIPHTVTSIGNQAFLNCKSLKSITIPNSVIDIGFSAFGSCDNLENVTIPASVISIGHSPFSSCESLTAIIVKDNNPNYISIDGVLFNKNKTELIQYPAGKTVNEYIIPSTVKSIGASAFSFCKNLTSINIPNSVTTIESTAFYWCGNLVSIIIPSSITSIGDYAFSNCDSLTSITIPNGVTSIESHAFSMCDGLTSITIPKSVTNIGEWSFFACGNLISIIVEEGNSSYVAEDGVLFNKNKTRLMYYPASKIDVEYKIPDGVTDIDEVAFYNCKNLIAITIPASIKSIGDDAFNIYWRSSLECVYYKGSLNDWANIAIGEDNTKLENANIHYNSTGNEIIVNEAVVPTCTTSGLTEGLCCSVCDTTILAQTVIPATGHTIVIDDAIAPTCSTTGKTEGSHCSVCNEVINAQITVPAKGHTASDWIIDTYSTCTENGSKHTVCTVCGKIETKTIVALGHTKVIDTAIPSTCTTAGKTDGSHCSICNTVLKTQDVIPATGHTMSGWIIDEEATCTENGLKHTECVDCGVIFDSVVIPALGHTIAYDEEVPPTCTTTGRTGGSHCIVCDEVLENHTVVPVVEHSPSEWIIDVNATMYNNGLKHKECTVCGKILESIIIFRINPSAPKVTTTNEIGGINVMWNAVEGATKYVVFRRTAGSKSWINIGATTGTLLLDKNVLSGIYYCYSVRAYNDAGQYSDFVSANTQTRKYMETPKLTGIFNATNGLYIKWNAVGGVTNGYRVYRRGAGSTYWTYLGTVKTTNFTDTSVKYRSGEYFRYTVIADGGYHSKFDTTGLYLKRLDNPTLLSATSSSAGITVKWSPIVATTGYYVYRKTANSSWVRIASVGGTNNTTFLDKTAKKGITYTYTVRAVYGATTSAYNSGISCYDKY